MKVALGQFAVSREWEENAETCLDLMQRAMEGRSDLLLLPEGILARDIADPDLVRRAAQQIDGPFVSKLLERSRGSNMTTMMSIHTPQESGRVWNVLIVVRDGKVVEQYRKLHLYDAFNGNESTNVEAGAQVPALVEVAGIKVGLMTCYDVRFPELAKRLAKDGAELLVLPAAWHKGPLKEMHWEVLVKARALDNTVYVAACGECGERNIGNSMVVDPLGMPIARAAEAPALLFAELDRERLAHARKVLPVLANGRFAAPVLSGEHS
ncbi:deaminated glutathione amidase [Burkholderia sp. Bp9131]|uniref:deaminated glutathione amidase n=1 Tax=Burkholderia sp. Bp9131 TaxID=2184571 RepID=UPI000F567618|nr:deaminated glutathione amidase [Burkholderia sp. Bp9131]RQR43467.1 deaminated glutathione amidase [Burkholderia sp. Bp9131]